MNPPRGKCRGITERGFAPLTADGTNKAEVNSVPGIRRLAWALSRLGKSEVPRESEAHFNQGFRITTGARYHRKSESREKASSTQLCSTNLFNFINIFYFYLSYYQWVTIY